MSFANIFDEENKNLAKRLEEERIKQEREREEKEKKETQAIKAEINAKKRKGIIVAISVVVAISTLAISVWLFAGESIAKSVNEVHLHITQGPLAYRWYTQNPQVRQFSISTAEELAALARIANGTTTTDKVLQDNFSGKTITLTDNIDLSQNNNWTPIGENLNDRDIGFSGIFNGNGKVISNLRINRTGTGRQGLFGDIRGGTVRNLELKNVNVSAGDAVGSLAGRVFKGNISQINVSGTVRGAGFVGGLAGVVADSAIVSGSTFSGTVNGSADRIGGLIGSLGRNSNVSGSGSSATIRGNKFVGGVAGWTGDNCRISTCYFTGSSVSGADDVGGITGYLENRSTITNSFSTGNVSASLQNGCAGGVVGHIENSSVSNSWSSGGVVSSNGGAGGIIGFINIGTVSNNAALNHLVRGSTNSGRVISNTRGRVTISNNTAFAGMLNNTGNNTWTNTGATTTNGVGISVATLNNDGTIGGRFTATNGWMIQNGSLPGLGRVVDMPAHLRVAGTVSVVPQSAQSTQQQTQTAPTQQPATPQRQATPQTTQSQNVEQARQRVERARLARDNATAQVREATQAGNTELARQRMETARTANQLLEQAEREYERLRREADRGNTGIIQF